MTKCYIVTKKKKPSESPLFKTHIQSTFIDIFNILLASVNRAVTLSESQWFNDVTVACLSVTALLCGILIKSYWVYWAIYMGKSVSKDIEFLKKSRKQNSTAHMNLCPLHQSGMEPTPSDLIIKSNLHYAFFTVNEGWDVFFDRHLIL